MIGKDRTPHVCALGFWLPCDQASFFHHEKDRELTQRTVLDRSFPEQNLLDVSIVRRLITVLPYKNYTHCFPVYHTSFARTSDPDAEVFVQEQFGEQWKGSLARDIEGHGLALIVAASGFYLWLALYSTPASRRHQQHDEDLVRAALAAHIREIVGGDFYSHFSGMDDDRPRASSEDVEQSIKEYCDNHEGILTFLQLNTILEGLYNSTLDFRVFFYTNQQQEEIKRAKKNYSVGKFVGSITAHVRIEQRKWTDSDYVHESHLFPEAAAPLEAQAEARIRVLLFELLTLHLEESSTKVPESASARRMAHQLCRSYLTRLTGERLLRRFLHVTAAETLLKLKRRVERCRRALLDTMIEVTHRQQPLIQVESPDEPQDRIVGVNPAQLRGYIMLFSAKLPLIANVRYYLKELRIGDQELSEEDPVRVPYRTWLVLLRALVSDVRGLERALEQSRMDALVQEEEQMRREEETIAEIERLQERTMQALEPVTTLAISVVSNVLAFAAVILAFASLLNGAQRGKQIVEGLPTGWAILVGLGAVLVGLFIIIALYGAIQLAFTNAFSLLLRARKRDRRRSGQYYYEMDMHLDRDIKSEQAFSLLNNAFEFPHHSQEMELRRYGLTFAKPERNSYRIERNSEDEALHKIYVDAEVVLRKPQWHLRTPKLHIVVVFEIMFHRPAQSETYILQDVRVVSTTSRILSPQEIGSFRRGVAAVFINPFISQDAQVQLEAQPASPGHAAKQVDSLLSLGEFLSAQSIPSLPDMPTLTTPSRLVVGINTLARRWWVPLGLYVLGIVTSTGAFFATHPPAAVLSWSGLSHVSLFDTLVLVLGRQPGLFLLPAILAMFACTLAWLIVKSESLYPPQPPPEGARAGDRMRKVLRWPHPTLLALSALGLLGTLVALAGVALQLIGG